jgi:hypothetical protein
MKLPQEHPIRNLPDDFKLYCFVVSKMDECGLDIDEVKEFAYEKARQENISKKCVSKVLRLVFICESDKDKMFNKHRIKRNA